MSSITGPGNAIGWAQYKLAGGWRNIWTVCGAYTLLLGITLVLTARVNAGYARQAMSIWTHALLGLQVAVLAFYCTLRLSGAVRRDLSSKMIDSHRLMPVPAAHAVAGYLLGATFQGLGLGAVNLMLGLIACLGAGLPASYWLIANAVLAGFCAMVWVLVTTEALCGTGAFIGFILPVLVVLYFTQGQLLAWIPGFALLASPLMGHTIADARTTMDPNLAMGMLCQGAIGTVLFIAAMRKYRRSDRPAFSPWLGLAWIAALVMSRSAGIWAWAKEPLLRVADEVPVDAQVLGTLFVLMLLSFPAIASAAWAEADWTMDAAAERIWGSGQVARRPLPVLLCAILCGAMISLVLLVPDRHWTAGRALPTSASVLLFMVCLSYVARSAHALGIRVLILVILWTLLLVGVPLLIDMVYRVIQEKTEMMGGLSAISPVGCLLEIWGTDRPDRLWAAIGMGLSAQAALTAGWACVYHGARRRNQRLFETRARSEQAMRAARAAQPVEATEATGAA